MAVMTLKGPVDRSDLGFTLPHEHAYCRLRQAPYRYDFPDQFADEETVVSELEGFVAQGGGTLVDLTVPNNGREPEKLLRLSERTGLHIVMGCGWYRENYFEPTDDLLRRQVSELADHLVAEVTEGVDGTGLRPGVLGEIGSEKTWVTPTEERVLRAVARAHRETGLSIGALHAVGPVAPQQLDILEDAGADLTRVAVGHCDSYPHLEYLLGLVERGAFLMFDNCGQFATLKGLEGQVVEVIVRLIDRGYGDRIMLSQDTCKMAQFRVHGGPGFTYVGETFLPLLREAGVDDATITRITAENPGRWLDSPNVALPPTRLEG